MRIRIVVVVALAGFAAGAARAQSERLNPPAPFVPADAAPSPGENARSLQAAARAQQMGLPSIAAAIFRPLLNAPGADHQAAMLGLATALLDEGDGPGAEKVLAAWTGERGAAWHLRKGLAAAAQGELTTARNERDASRIDDLPAADRGWHFFLQGTIATMQNEPDKAQALFGQAAEAAGSALARAQFRLKEDESRLRAGGPVSREYLDATKKNLEAYQGRKVGYDIARTYAAMLDAAGRKSEAIEVLQKQIVALPAEEREELDEMRLLLGLIAGAADGAGRNALGQLLANGSDRDKQRMALELLARASPQNPQLADFQQKLDELIRETPPHPILEDLLLFRAQVALELARVDKTTAGYAQAEDDARELLEKFPGSPLKAQAYGVLTDAAWEQRRYRTAADDAVKARAELAPGPERAALGVLIAEAWFRAHDYRSAADAYAAALRERPADLPAGELMFQRVLAEIEAGAPDAAATVLDALAEDPQFDQVDRWQAEWNLARALQAKGKTTEAYGRVTNLLAGKPGGGAPAAAGAAAALPVELRARMAWLQARLAMGAGKPDEALRLADAIGGALDKLPPGLKTEIASSTALLRGEANFALGRDAAALEALKKLRADFPRSDAAVYSYFDEAEHYARQDKTVEAQQLLTKLADDFPDNAYAPFALFQAARQAERRGQEANLREANRLIEDLVNRYPQSDLVFAARLKQGDLLRKLNDFPAAQRAYEALVNKYPQRPDIALAQLALAETHNAQAANDPAHTESALVLFEHVRDRVDASIDARVEAGYNLGRIHERRNETAKAETVWWSDVVNEFLLNEQKAGQLGDKGRYWMTRTLLDLGALYEQDEKLEQAKQAWLLILNARLGYGEALARARLARFNLAEATR